jgi:hypothetical protein
MAKKYMVKFWNKTYWQFGELDTEKNVVKLPSGRDMQIDKDGNVILDDGTKSRIYDALENTDE